MARYTGPVYKKSRRLGFSILENGKELAKRPYAPGAHGNDKRRKSSEYGVQLAEKQKIRLMYGLNYMIELLKWKVKLVSTYFAY